MSIGCPICGRNEADGGGHWMGCAATLIPQQKQRKAPEEPPAPEPEPEFDPAVVADACTFGDCTNPRWSDDKRVKYCEDHKDLKNRKE